MGLGLGHGTTRRAALITRGLAEIARLGHGRSAARPETFMGLSAGAGDLILTATGDLSRNRRVGLELARGPRAARDPREPRPRRRGRALRRRKSRASPPRAASRMPVTDAVKAVLEERLTPAAAVELLLSRDLKMER